MDLGSVPDARFASGVSLSPGRSKLIVRLADFIDANAPAILAEWEDFAGTLLPAASGLDTAALRDHAEQILQAVSKDLRAPQTRGEQSAKSKGQAIALLNAGKRRRKRTLYSGDRGVHHSATGR